MPGKKKTANLYQDQKLKAPRFLIGTSSHGRSSQGPLPSPPTERRAANQPRVYHFLIVNDPTQPIPPAEQKRKKQLVMQDYLRASGGDPRPKHQRLNATSRNGPPGRDSSGQISSQTSSDAISTAPSSPLRNTGFVTTVVDSSNTTASIPADDKPTTLQDPHAVLWRGASNVIYQPISFIGGNTLYLATAVTDLLSVQGGIGHRVNPFNCWPAFCRPEVEVEYLKWRCSRCFASRGLSENWVPALTRSAVAFYSTIFISSAHDDVMLRELSPSAVRTASESFRRVAARHGTIQMINETIGYQGIDDGVVIAVLHTLHSELITGDEQTIDIHRRGLHALVEKRGSLYSLGIRGLLAKVVVITMLLIGAASEQSVDPIYTAYADTINTEPPASYGGFPEYPIYAASGFYSLRSADRRCDPTIHLLELTQQASAAFAVLHSVYLQAGAAVNCHKMQAEAMLKSHRDRIFDFHDTPAISSVATARFEAVRLAARIHVQALEACVPHSQAAKELDDVEAAVRGRGMRCDSVVDPPEPEHTPILLQLKEVLKRSEVDQAWGGSSGVLLWVTLVALTSSHNDSSEQHEGSVKLEADVKAARQFMAAIVVRCCTLHIFEHTTALLGMLKRFIALQQVLAEAAARRTKMSPQCELHDSASDCNGDGSMSWLDDSQYSSDFM